MHYEDLPDRFDLSPDTGGLLSTFFRDGNLIFECVDEATQDQGFLEFDEAETRDLHVQLTALMLRQRSQIDVEAGGKESLIVFSGDRLEFNLCVYDGDDDNEGAVYSVRLEKHEGHLLYVQLTALVLQQRLQLN